MNAARRRLLAIALPGWLLPCALWAGLNTWTNVGPFVPGGVCALAIDAANPDVVYAGTKGGGVFRSTDSGATWSADNGGMTELNVCVLAAQPGTSSIFASNSTHGTIFKRADSGIWTPVSGSVGAQALAVAAGSPAVIYAAPRNFATGAILKSADGGITWAELPVGLAFTGINAFAADPRSSSTVYAAAAGSGTFNPSGGGVFKSTDGGETWSGRGPEPFMGSLTIDPGTPSTLYTSSVLGNLYKSADAGSSWFALLSGRGSTTPLTVDPANSSVLFAGGPSGQLLKSADGGAHWSVAHSNSLGYARAIAIDPTRPSRIYAGWDQGLTASVDGGTTWTFWTPNVAGLAVPVVAADPRAPSTVYLGGAFKSLDSGAHWTDIGNGLPAAGVNDLAFDSGASSTLYAALGRGGMYKSTNGGVDWTAANTGLPGDFFGVGPAFALAVDPFASATIYAGTVDGVFKTTDAGQHWIPRNAGPAGVFVNSIAIDVGPSGAVYAASQQAVFKSTDSGATWTSTGPPGIFINRIVADPFRAGTLFVAGSGLLRTTDGGEHWTALNAGLAEDLSVQTLAASPTIPGLLYASGYHFEQGLVSFSRSGVFRSLDGGDHWADVSNGLWVPFVSALAVGSGLAPAVYAGTEQGVFVSTIGDGPATCAAGLATLCLASGRFRIEVAWQADSRLTGVGQALPLAASTGAFWFFSPDNLELVIKVLDGRSINGKFWVFYGALSNVEYTITVTDTQTGAVKTFFNPQGQLASVADTGAF